MIGPRRLATFILAVACFVFPGSARGGLELVDWKSPGDHLLTFDTSTGDHWLNLTVTTDQSYNYVESQFGAGGLYAGFHHATYSELVTLQMDAGIPDIGQYTPANLAPVEYLQSFVGITDSVAGSQDSDAFYSGMQFSPSGYHDRFHLEAPFLGDNGVSNFYGDNGAFDDNYHDPRVGQWLVMPSSVPEPSALPILATGVIPVLWWVRRARRG